MSKKIKMIIASTRDGRVGKHIADWVTGIAKDNNVELEVLDLKEINLPFFTGKSPAYFPPEKEEEKAWAGIIGEADAFVFVTPEYNRSVPASLKNAIDYLSAEWKEKPAAIIGYGHIDGGSISIKHLKDILDWCKVAYVEPVAIQLSQDHFDPTGGFKDIDTDLASYKDPIAAALKAVNEA